MVQAVKKSLSLKVSLTLAVVTLVLTSTVAFLITSRQTRAMEELTLNKGRLAAALGAQTYSSMLEDAIDNGYLTVDDVFDRTYEPIKGYDFGGPAKYHTKYDFYTDRVVLKFQDRFLESQDFVYAVGSDANGYVPTHNTAFQRPLTGDAAQDRASNLTKRIFNDPVELAAASNREPALIQRYQKDDGPMMWDVSSPILVKGKHWGGFRVGVSMLEIASHKAELVAALAATFTTLGLLTVGIIFLMIKRAMQPLEALATTAARISVGDGLEIPIQPATPDEVGRMAKSLDRLRASLKAAMARLGEE
jgi:HAMP domain-containing protein